MSRPCLARNSARFERVRRLKGKVGANMGKGAGRWMSWKELWTEHRPAPLNLSDREILDWLGEYCDQAVYTRPTPQYRGGFTLYCDEIKTSGQTLREAVCLAAAKLDELNQ